MNKNYFAFFLIVLGVVVILSSGCRKEITTDKENVRGSIGISLTAKIPPGKCRITGTIVKIHPAAAEDESSPCSKYPCIANVLVDSVWGYGQAFKKPVKTGREITLKFEFTLAPASKEIFENLDTRLPGLEINSMFTGDIEYLAPSENIGVLNDNTYSIFLYNKLK